jgi:hypothetical protein
MNQCTAQAPATRTVARLDSAAGATPGEEPIARLAVRGRSESIEGVARGPGLEPSGPSVPTRLEGLSQGEPAPAGLERGADLEPAANRRTKRTRSADRIALCQQHEAVDHGDGRSKRRRPRGADRHEETVGRRSCRRDVVGRDLDLGLGREQRNESTSVLTGVGHGGADRPERGIEIAAGQREAGSPRLRVRPQFQRPVEGRLGIVEGPLSQADLTEPRQREGRVPTVE